MSPGAPPPRFSSKPLSDSDDSEAHAESATDSRSPAGPGPVLRQRNPRARASYGDPAGSRLSCFSGLAIECPLYSQANWQGNL